ncbi:hypothetical protein [Methanosarcina barkeri]|uniref:hypothetical protein n=1 Tax=Methanosarcina barkeri TaxID=2208 RepID=UPI000B0ED873|nr:hypothetical protein [Methanosarcina barkeri]
MISCPICKFHGLPHEEHRTGKTLQSCPQCGVVIRTIVKNPLVSSQAREAMQNAA